VIIQSTRVVLPEGVRPASIRVENGVIARVGERGDGSDEIDAIDVGDLVVSPGIVDTHVHVNEPGRGEWEGFDTATRAAAAGGVTTIIDMPLNSIPATTTVAALEAKRAAARGRCHVDVGFWGGVVPGNSGDLEGLIAAGVRGFKCFLSPSGVPEFEHVGEADLRQALPVLARRGVPLLVHAEAPQLLNEPRGTDYAAFLESRPPSAEVDAIRMMAALAHEFNARVHIVHVASAEAADEIARARAQGVPITAETCPHYLTFAAEEIPAGATEFKCAPPIREARHRDALWNALDRGVLDFVATDHSPAPEAMKCRGDFSQAWGGIASLELSLATVWSALRAGDRVEGFARLARWLSNAPAALARANHRKGRIAADYDADLVVWDPDAEFTVSPDRLQQRHKLTPYDGRTLRGVVRATYLRGERVWDGTSLTAERKGRLL